MNTGHIILVTQNTINQEGSWDARIAIVYDLESPGHTGTAQESGDSVSSHARSTTQIVHISTK
jgi:hypothetical protein